MSWDISQNIFLTDERVAYRFTTNKRRPNVYFWLNRPFNSLMWETLYEWVHSTSGKHQIQVVRLLLCWSADQTTFASTTQYTTLKTVWQTVSLCSVVKHTQQLWFLWCNRSCDRDKKYLYVVNVCFLYSAVSVACISWLVLLVFSTRGRHHITPEPGAVCQCDHVICDAHSLHTHHSSDVTTLPILCVFGGRRGPEVSCTGRMVVCIEWLCVWPWNSDFTLHDIILTFLQK